MLKTNIIVSKNNNKGQNNNNNISNNIQEINSDQNLYQPPSIGPKNEIKNVISNNKNNNNGIADDANNLVSVLKLACKINDKSSNANLRKKKEPTDNYKRKENKNNKGKNSQLIPNDSYISKNKGNDNQQNEKEELSKNSNICNLGENIGNIDQKRKPALSLSNVEESSTVINDAKNNMDISGFSPINDDNDNISNNNNDKRLSDFMGSDTTISFYEEMK